jgi:hypothetical protein
VHTKYKKTVERQKDIENNFYWNGFPNDDLENKFWKES